MSEFFVSIRPATQADVLLLQQLSINTFNDTYSAYNTPQNMQLYIDKYYNTERLLSELSDTATQFLLAYAGEELAGYIKLRTTEKLPELAGKSEIEIERIYVLSTMKGMKIGTRLIEHAIETGRRQQCEVIWLGVWQENKDALAFYIKQGFIIFGQHDFMLGTERQTDWLMKKEI